MTVKESDIQGQLEKYLNLKGIRFVRFPDSLYRFIFANPKIPPHIKKQCSEFMKGVPDLIILTPSESYNQCLLLEVKRDDGKVTQGQKNWHKGLNVSVGYGLEECMQMIDDFISFVDAQT